MNILKHWFGKARWARAGSRPRSVRLQVEILEDRTVPTVNFYGGNLLPHVEAQPLFLGSEWSSAPTNAAQTTTLNSFLSNVTGGAYMDALSNAGYNVGRGTATAGALDTTSVAANTTITDASIQATITSDIARGLLKAPDANRLYIVYVEPNVAVSLANGQGTTQQGILGYHGAFAGPNGATIRYAVIAYPGGTVGNSSLGTASVDQLTAVTSHELAEAVTDPDVNYSQLGWYDSRRGEIGDITEGNPNALVRLHGYLIQEAATRNDQVLLVNTSPPAPPAPPPAPAPVPATPAAPAATTTTIAVTPLYNPYFIPMVNVTVTISSSSGAAVTGGVIALIVNGAVIGEAQVRDVNGVATAQFTVEFFQYGVFALSTEYLGAAGFQPSLSNSVYVYV